ncbi:hypothetical protein BSKO_11438 [Bryopsis sp. KO-2023]|nr:hypothetical protein BSKO_11438 [Bryopsis sp. KO-2023]
MAPPATPMGAPASNIAPAVATKPIKLIATDVDGTLLNSEQRLTPGVLSALTRAAEAGVPTVLATGKAPGPWLKYVLPQLPQSMPIVFLQGLLAWDADGNVLYERCLENDIVTRCIRFAKEHGQTVTLYCGNRILCESTDEHTDRLIFYSEPTPEAVGPLEDWVGKISVHKLIFMAPHDRILEMRPHAQEAFGKDASLTTALPGMLEVLPPGASKGSTLELVLEKLGVDAENMMAMGDGENDLQMLNLAGVAIAMGNAGANVKSVADFVVSTNDDDGVAEAIERFALSPQSTPEALS